MTEALRVTDRPDLDARLEILTLEAKLEANEVRIDDLLDDGESWRALRQMWESFMLRRQIDRLEHDLE